MQLRFAFLFFFCAALHALSPPFYSANRRHVANNLTILDTQGSLTPGLESIYTTLSTFAPDNLNNALNKFHPALYSDLLEIQAAVGGQLLSLFHRRPFLGCGCKKNGRFRLEPIGNWLREDSRGGQTGFEAWTKGGLIGLDGNICEYFSLGIAGSASHTKFHAHKKDGEGTINRYLGSIYADFQMDCFYMGLSAYGGIDHNHVERFIQFPSYSATTHSEFTSLDIAGQFSAAYLFGAPYCYLYPYANVDYLYFRGQKIRERGSSALNLQVREHKGGTIRTEAGIGLQFADSNLNETICVEPTFAFGWVMECPVGRDAYIANFEGEALNFEAKGWNHTWQLLSVQLGIAIYIHNFLLKGEYISEMSGDSFDDFWSQRANIALDFIW